jgi:hypothetical protein
VWVGGNSRAALRRAAVYEGWAPFHTGGFAPASRTAAIESLEDLATAIGVVRSMVTETGGDRPFDVCWSESLISDATVSADERCSRLRAIEATGVTWTTVTIPGETRPEVLDGVDTFGREVLSALSSA